MLECPGWTGHHHALKHERPWNRFNVTNGKCGSKNRTTTFWGLSSARQSVIANQKDSYGRLLTTYTAIQDLRKNWNLIIYIYEYSVYVSPVGYTFCFLVRIQDTQSLRQCPIYRTTNHSTCFFLNLVRIADVRLLLKLKGLLLIYSGRTSSPADLLGVDINRLVISFAERPREHKKTSQGCQFGTSSRRGSSIV